MKTINNALIRSFSPCYDPSRYIKDEVETLSVVEWVSKYRGTVPDEDIIWLLCHKEFLSDKDLRLFAVWCAREALKLIDNPDPRSIEACNVAERYANGEATKEELGDAYDADVAYRAAAAYCATYDADAAGTAAFRSAACYAAGGDITIRAAQLDKLLTYFNGNDFIADVSNSTVLVIN